MAKDKTTSKDKSSKDKSSKSSDRKEKKAKAPAVALGLNAAIYSPRKIYGIVTQHGDKIRIGLKKKQSALKNYVTLSATDPSLFGYSVSTGADDDGGYVVTDNATILDTAIDAKVYVWATDTEQSENGALIKGKDGNRDVYITQPDAFNIHYSDHEG